MASRPEPRSVARLAACIAATARRLRGDRRGMVAVKAAFVLMPAIGFSAFAVDVGSFFYAKRRLQTAADLAAITAATDLARARDGAVASLSGNGYGAAQLSDVIVGRYTPDSAAAPAARFSASPVALGNAARVTLAATAPTYFGKALTGQSEVAMTATATAARTAVASFAIGSRLVSVQGGVLNALLSALTGSTVSLSVMDYNALVSGQIDLFAFSKALNSRLNLNALTFDEIVDAEATVGQILGAMADSTQDAGTRAALQRVPATGTQRVKVKDLMNLGPYAMLSLDTPPSFGVSVAAFDMLSTTLQLANGSNQIALSTGLGIPGVLAAKLKVAVGERPVGTSWVAVGTEGAKVHTAQTRVLLEVTLPGASPLATLRVPIYIEVAAASAELKSISCGLIDMSTTRVTVAATPAVVDAWIGDVSDAEFNNLSTPPNPPAAVLGSVAGLVTVRGRAHVTITNLQPADLSFSYAEIQSRTKKSVATQDFLASLVSRLLRDTDVTVSVVGLGLGLPGGLSTTVGNALSAAATPIDNLLSSLLGALGISLGQADIWVNGVRCDQAVLVQ